MAMGRKPFILQIVGYQNNGKTTLVQKLVRRFTNQGHVVGTIKHHGHGGKPEAGDEQKDTFRHRQAGAAVTGVEGAGMLQIHAEKEGWTLLEIIGIYEKFPLDLILIEGYKQEKYEKVVLIRSVEEMPLLDGLQNVMCVISWEPVASTDKRGYPFFHIHNEQSYLNWLAERVENSLE
jgi:molybdopterin-guanine dinucleotide biosynthesis protein B